MDQMWLEISAWATTVFAVAGVAGISIAVLVATAYGFFKFLGEKWLNNKFAEKLESYRSEQARELERLRHKINGVFDRTKRLHDREYEILPDIWAKLVEANGSARAYLSSFQEYPDISQMTDRDLDEFLAETRFSVAQKREIASATNKIDTFVNIYERYRYHDVMEKIRESSISLRKSGIFVIPILREDMHKMIDLIHAAVVEKNINREEKVRPQMREESKRLKEEGGPLFKKIEESVAARLWDSVVAEF